MSPFEIITMTDNVLFNITWHEELSSTNAYIKEIINTKSAKEFDTICTKNQVAGKGQGNNQWESERDKNLTFSLLLQPTFIEIQEQFVISKSISLAIIRVLNNYHEGFKIKWPNDIYFNEHKIAGILIENTLINNTIGNSIIGIGININQEEFISDAPNPISLKQITHKNFNITELLNEILQSIAEYYIQLKDGNHQHIHREYLTSLFRGSGLHPFKDSKGLFYAAIKGINEYGNLILELEDKETRTYAFKEVEFILH